MDQRAAASLLHAAAFGLRAPLAGDQIGGFDLDLAVAFRTIFAKQSLVSTLQRSSPAELGGFQPDRGWHGIRNHASKEAREHGLSGGLDAALLPRTRDAQC